MSEPKPVAVEKIAGSYYCLQFKGLLFLNQ